MRGLLLALMAAVSAVTASPTYDSQVAFKASQAEPASVSSAFDKIEDDAKQWAQNGRDFIDRDGLICESGYTLVVLPRLWAHLFI